MTLLEPRIKLKSDKREYFSLCFEFCVTLVFFSSLTQVVDVGLTWPNGKNVANVLIKIAEGTIIQPRCFVAYVSCLCLFTK